METTVELVHQHQVATIWLKAANERKPPTLDFQTFDRLESILDEIERGHKNQPQDWQAVVLRSTSQKFFCAGANIQVLKNLNPKTMDAWIIKGHTVLGRIEALSAPVIAVVEGYALGGGLELSLACDFIYASNEAKFGLTEARLGFVAGWLGGYRLSRRIGVPMAKELALTGKIITADEALRIGIVNYAASSEQLDSNLEATLDMIRQNSSSAMFETKIILNQCYDGSLSDIAASEIAASRRCIANKDTLDRIEHFLNKKS